MNREFIVEGTADGRPVKVRVFAQNADQAQRFAKQETGARSWSYRSVTEV